MITNRLLLMSLGFFIILDHTHGIDLTKKHESNGWICLNSSGTINHYERWFANDHDSIIRERKCELVVECNINSAFDFLADPLNNKKWMKEVKMTKLLHQVSDDKKYAYTIFELPWPFNDKDLVSSYQALRINIDHYEIYIRSAMNQNLIEEYPQIDRIKEYKATWVLIRLKDNKTKISYTVTSDIHTKVPRFIQDPIVLKICIRNFALLKQQLLHLQSTPDQAVLR